MSEGYSNHRYQPIVSSNGSGLLKKALNKAPVRNTGIKNVKSGIGLSSLSDPIVRKVNVLSSSSESKEEAEEKVPTSFITSRTARVLLAGAGFLADAYDLFVINLVLRLLREQYPQYADSGMLHAYEGAVASSALFGSIVGQLVAGSLADVIGRKKIFVATALLITIGSLGSSISSNHEYLTVYGNISMWRFVLGIGVGGEYPLAATVTSESSSAGRRGSIMAAVFAMQGVGALLSVLVVILCLGIGCSSGFTWRFALAFGAVPAMLAFPWRLRMHETETFERVKQERKDAAATVTTSTVFTSTSSHYGSTDNISNSNSNTADYDGNKGINHALATSKSRWEEIKYAFRFYKWHLLGTAMSWFLLDGT